MTIRHNRPVGVHDDAGQAQQVHHVQNARTSASKGESEDDAVGLSADLRLFQAAMDAAAEAPAIRQEVVERARARLAAEEIGWDPERLADYLIDSALEVTGTGTTPGYQGVWDG